MINIKSTLRLLTIIVLASLTLFSCSCNDDDENTVQLTGIFISSDHDNLYVGVTAQLTATGVYSDGSSQEITNSVTWGSDNTAIITVTNTGLVTGVNVGSSIITAIFGGITSEVKIEVKLNALESIHIESEDTSINKGLHAQLMAVGVYSDGNTVDLTEDSTWSVSDESIALVSNISGEKGLLSAVEIGTVNVSAQFNGFTTTRGYVVTEAVISYITVFGPDEVLRGSNVQFVSVAHYSDGTKQNVSNDVFWITSNSEIAEVDQNGKVTGVATGDASISAEIVNLTGSQSIFVEDVNTILVSNTTQFRNALQVAAVDGRPDRILLTDGIYNVDDDGQGSFVYTPGTGNGDLYIEGTDKDNVTIDGNGLTRALYIARSGIKVSLKSLTIKNGRTVHTEIVPLEGAGAYITATDVIINGCVFDSNVSDSKGGGLHTFSGTSLTIINSLFYNNKILKTFSGSGGGGLYSDRTKNVAIFNTKFRNNSANNSSSHTGGAMVINVENGIDVSVGNSVFTGNVSGRFGAVDISSFSDNDGSIRFSNTIFDSNNGGAFYTSLKYADIVNSLFINNSIGVTLAGNSSTRSSLGSFYNVSFWNNAGDDILNSGAYTGVVLEHCYIDLAKISAPFIENNTIYNLTPNFKDETNGDYRLTSSSIMIDSGLSTHPNIEIPLIDLNGVFRPIDASTDIGPYEFDPMNP